MHTPVGNVYTGADVTEIKMSINGLSNHLCVVVATIISLIVASSTFHQARASTDSYDFTNSRQYKRNLAVSKFREHPHWLPNYTWKPPEKFYGPRKRPPWEMDEVPETAAERKEREEREEWEKNMREVSRREREKWKIYETDEPPGTQSSGQILIPPDDDGEPPASRGNHENETSQANYSSRKESLQNKSTKGKDEVEKVLTEAPTEWKKDLHNGRWGMSITEPAAPGLLKNTLTPQKSSLMSRTDKRMALPTPSFNGRWGMSIKEAPKDFLKEVPVEPGNLESSDIPMAQDLAPVGNEANGTTGSEEIGRLPKSGSNGSRVVEVEEVSEEAFSSDTSALSREQTNDRSTVWRSNVLGQSIDPSESGEEAVAPTTFPSGRWGMSAKEVPKEFLKEMSRRSRPPGSSGRVWTDRTPAGNIKIHAGQKDGGKTEDVPTGTVATKLSNGSPSGRWATGVGTPPGDFLREISKRGPTRLREVYRPRTIHQLVDANARNNPLSGKSMLSTTSGIPNGKTFLRPYLNLEIPAVPLYLVIVPL